MTTSKAMIAQERSQKVTNRPPTKRRRKKPARVIFPPTPIPTPKPLPPRYGPGVGAKYLCPICLGIPDRVMEDGCTFCLCTGRWGWV